MSDSAPFQFPDDVPPLDARVQFISTGEASAGWVSEHRVARRFRTDRGQISIDTYDDIRYTKLDDGWHMQIPGHDPGLSALRLIVLDEPAPPSATFQFPDDFPPRGAWVQIENEAGDVFERQIICRSRTCEGDLSVHVADNEWMIQRRAGWEHFGRMTDGQVISHGFWRVTVLDR